MSAAPSDARPEWAATDGQSRFRPEIQGLRALAVLGVVLFHSGIAGFSGGYAGVDIFFVISGYLITRSIRDELRAGTFTLSQFYERRARRIVPALVATLVASLIAGALWLPPGGLEALAEQTLASLGFVANIYFWLASHAYFAADSDHLPLLHLWSLAVEGQVYLLWPLILLAFGRRRWTVPVIITITAISLGAAQWYWDNDASAAFYLTPFRLYQFGLGAVVLLLERKRPASRIVSQGAFAAGLIISLAALLGLEDSQRLASLLASGGTALVIYAGSPRPLSSLLTNPLAVSIGERSYSIYLAHWPVMVFADYVLGEPAHPVVIAGSIAAALGLGAVMYAFVEKPFRRPRSPRVGRISVSSIAGLAAAGLLVGGVALTALADRGWPWRLTEAQREINRLEGPGSGACEIRRAICRFGAAEAEADLLLMGDSYVEHYIAGLDVIAKAQGIGVDAYISGGCLVLDGLLRIGYEDARCRSDRDRILAALTPGDQPIVISQAWMGYLNGSVADDSGRPIDIQSEQQRLDILRQALERTIARLNPDQRRFMIVGSQVVAEHCSFDVYRFGVAPLWHEATQDCPPVNADVARSQTAAVDAMLEAVAAKFPGRVTVLRPVDYMCASQCEFISDHVARYRDPGHLSVAGSEHFANRARSAITSFLEGR